MTKYILIIGKTERWIEISTSSNLRAVISNMMYNTIVLILQMTYIYLGSVSLASWTTNIVHRIAMSCTDFGQHRWGTARADE